MLVYRAVTHVTLCDAMIALPLLARHAKYERFKFWNIKLVVPLLCGDKSVYRNLDRCTFPQCVSIDLCSRVDSPSAVAAVKLCGFMYMMLPPRHKSYLIVTSTFSWNYTGSFQKPWKEKFWWQKITDLCRKKLYKNLQERTKFTYSYHTGSCTGERRMLPFQKSIYHFAKRIWNKRSFLFLLLLLRKSHK